MAKEVKYSETEQSLLIKALGYSPKLRILDLFLTNPFFDFSKEELAKELGMSKQTLYKNFYDLEELGIVTISRKIGRAHLYKINKHHPLIKSLDEIITEISLQIGKREAQKRVKE